jgi:hypothetical protein
MSGVIEAAPPLPEREASVDGRSHAPELDERLARALAWWLLVGIQVVWLAAFAYAAYRFI